MNLLKAIQQARWVPAAMSIANQPQIYHKTGRDHGCETIAGKDLYQHSPRAFRMSINRHGYDLGHTDTSRKI